MKILFANSMKGLGGGERWLLDTATGMRARGHAVWVAARRGAPARLVARHRLQLLYNGIRPATLPDRAASRAALGAAPGDALVVCVARLAARKGHDTLLEAWGRVIAGHAGARLLLVGSGSEEQ